MLTDKEIRKYALGTPYSFNDIKVLVKEVQRIEKIQLTKADLDYIIQYCLRGAVSAREAAEALRETFKKIQA